MVLKNINFLKKLAEKPERRNYFDFDRGWI